MTTLSDPSPLRVDIHKPVPKRAIRALAKIIAEKFHPDKILLFGSHAYGHPKPWSDVDVLVVMDTPNGEWPLMEGIRDSLPRICSSAVTKTNRPSLTRFAFTASRALRSISKPSYKSITSVLSTSIRWGLCSINAWR